MAEGSTSLEDFKAEVEAEDADATAQTDENTLEKDETGAAPQATDDNSGTNEVDDKDGKTDDGAEPDPDKPDDSETEDWMKGDDHASQAEKKYTGGDIGRAKEKLKTKLANKNSELDEANARIAELERANAAPVAPVKLERPKREDYFEHDSPDEAYDADFEKYLLNTVDSRQAAANATTQQQQQQANAQQALAKGEDAHYERVEKLVTKSGIKTENYQAADLAFRQAIDNAVPGGGDNIAAHFMGLLGEGSGEVVYNMGINSDKLGKLTSLLIEDPNGLKATVYLTELKGNLTSSKKRTTTAPKPVPDINSDVKSSGEAKALEKKFASANTTQEQMDILRQARIAGIDSKNW